MKLNFREFMGMSLSKDSPAGTSDLGADERAVKITGEDSKNKPPKSKDRSSFNPDKLYGRSRKK